jgi:hypothetical protein
LLITFGTAVNLLAETVDAMPVIPWRQILAYLVTPVDLDRLSLGDLRMYPIDLRPIVESPLEAPRLLAHGSA